MGTQSDFRVKKDLIVGDGTISSGDNANLVLRRDFDDTTYNQITLGDDTYKITLDNSDRFYIDGFGKVGLGTTSPSERLDIRDSGTPKLLVRTTATSSQEAHIIIGGARTTSTTADISRVIFDTYDSDIGGSESNTLAEITVRKQAASSDQGNLLFKTNSGDNNISEAMRIDKDGNVGIGVTPSAAKLEVGDGTDLASINPTYVQLYNSDGSSSNATVKLWAETWGAKVGTTSSDDFFIVSANSDRIKFDGAMRSTFYGSASADPIIRLATGDTTVSDTDDLGVIEWVAESEGDGTDGDARLVAASVSAVAEANFTDTANTAALVFKTATSEAATEKMRISNTGNVGIGTTSPDTLFEIKEGGSGAAVMRLRNSNTSYPDDTAFGRIEFYNADASGAGITAQIEAVSDASGRGGQLAFKTDPSGTSPSTRMFIQGDGNVGIGTTAPTHMLHLSDDSRVDIKFTRASHQDHYIRKDGDYLRIRGNDDSTILMEIRNNNSSNHISFPNSNIGIGTTTPGYALDIQKADAKINLKDTSDTDDMLVRFEGSDGNEYGVVGYEGSTVFKIESPQGRVINIGGHANVKVGVTTADMTFTPSALFHVNGALKATTKSFDIEHPTKEGMRLHHGVLEGPEHGVYIRGHQVGETIELPDYWLGLVDEDTITVQLTAKGRTQNLYVKSVDREKVVVGGFITKSPDFYYFIQAERKDVDKMEVEYGIVH